MKAGTYTMVLYCDEFEVGRKSVPVGASATMSSSIASTKASTAPACLRTAGFPMAQIKAVNNPTTIKFTLTSSQTGAATLRIGTTLSFAGGRPQVTVNGWPGPAPDAPVDIYDAVELVTTGTSTSPTATTTTTVARLTTTSGGGTVPLYGH
ncbi:hypothetical protein FRC09_015583 [Ceratobasidium sp. 395]|nr:hypothetical protein FRC09_015583 [Ceratobasidium sp. 395]